MEKTPLKTALPESNFFTFDDVQVTLLRTELGVLLDNSTRVYNVVNRKVTAEPKEAEETTNQKIMRRQKKKK
jgi:hypothetical protein